MNRVLLVGHTGSTPDIRMSKTSSPVAVFCMATDMRWVDPHGEKKQKTDWHKVVVFRPKLVSWCEQYLTKGLKIIVEGQLCNRKNHNQEGQDYYSSEIIIGCGGYGHITALSPLPTSKQSNEDEEEDDEDRIALQHALAQHPSSTHQLSQQPWETH